MKCKILLCSKALKFIHNVHSKHKTLHKLYICKIYIRPGFNYKNTITITLSIIAFQRISVELQLQLHLQGQLQLQLLSNFIGLKLHLKY